MKKSRRWIPLTVIIVFALGGALGAKGVGGFLGGCASCMRVAGPAIVRAAIVTAVIIGRAVELAQHDAHYHSEECGHQRRYYDRHWVYHYQNRWEYQQDGRWYGYQGGPPAPAPSFEAPPPFPPPPAPGPAPAAESRPAAPPPISDAPAPPPAPPLAPGATPRP